MRAAVWLVMLQGTNLCHLPLHGWQPSQVLSHFAALIAIYLIAACARID
jgi:hypothetical protein